MGGGAEGDPCSVGVGTRREEVGEMALICRSIAGQRGCEAVSSVFLSLNFISSKGRRLGVLSLQDNKNETAINVTEHVPVFVQ